MLHGPSMLRISPGSHKETLAKTCRSAVPYQSCPPHDIHSFSPMNVMMFRCLIFSMSTFLVLLPYTNKLHIPPVSMLIPRNKNHK